MDDLFQGLFWFYSLGFEFLQDPLHFYCPPDIISSLMEGAEMLALSQHCLLQIQHLCGAGGSHFGKKEYINKWVLFEEVPSLTTKL